MAPVEQYLVADRNAEIALARSAGPAAVSDKAEILVLGAHGYETAVQGSNGFVCFQERSWAKRFRRSGVLEPEDPHAAMLERGCGELGTPGLSQAHPVGARGESPGTRCWPGRRRRWRPMRSARPLRGPWLTCCRRISTSHDPAPGVEAALVSPCHVLRARDRGLDVGRKRSWRSDLLDHERCGTDHDLLRVGTQMVRWEFRSLRPDPGCHDGESREPSPRLTDRL